MIDCTVIIFIIRSLTCFLARYDLAKHCMGTTDLLNILVKLLGVNNRSSFTSRDVVSTFRMVVVEVEEGRGTGSAFFFASAAPCNNGDIMVVFGDEKLRR